MKTILLYTVVVLIWGSTWFGIKLQLGIVPSQVSVAYRFALAALLLFVWCWVRRLRMQFSFREHLWLMLQGLTVFSCNYALFYEAETLGVRECRHHFFSIDGIQHLEQLVVL